LETISYALAVNELTAELLVDRLDPRDITVSADGRLVAFVAAPVGQPEEHPRNAVWLAQSDVPHSARRFTSGTADDRGPQFAPDGTSLYFLSDREERKVAQLYRVSLEGGEARPLTEGKPGIAAYAPLADGRRVVLVCADAPSEEDERREQERDDPTVFGDWKPQRMRLLDLEAGETRTLTCPAEKHVSTVAPAPEGSLAAVVLWETPEIDNRSRSGELVVIDVDVDEIVARWRLAAGDATVVWRGSGDLRILGSVEAGGQAGLGLFVAGLDDEELQLVTGSLDADPMSLALGSVVAVARGLDTELARLGDDEGLVPLSSHPGTLFALAASSCGDVVACVAYHRVPDVWAGPPDGELVRVSNLAPELAGVEWRAGNASRGALATASSSMGCCSFRAGGRGPAARSRSSWFSTAGRIGASRTTSKSRGLPRASGSRRRAMQSSVPTRVAASGTAPDSRGQSAPEWASPTGPTSNPGSTTSFKKAWPIRSGSLWGAGARAAT